MTRHSDERRIAIARIAQDDLHDSRLKLFYIYIYIHFDRFRDQFRNLFLKMVEDGGIEKDGNTYGF